jgi:hypothetical protein
MTDLDWLDDGYTRTFQVKFAYIPLGCDFEGNYIISDESKIYTLTEKQMSLSGFLNHLTSFPQTDEPHLIRASTEEEFRTVDHVVNYLMIRDGKISPRLAKPLAAPKDGSKINILDSIGDAKVRAWLNDIMNTNKSHLIGIVRWAQYLNIDCLLHLASAAIASRLSGVDRSKYKEVFSPDPSPILP